MTAVGELDKIGRKRPRPTLRYHRLPGTLRKATKTPLVAIGVPAEIQT